jgi:hypothetical protein
MAGKEQRQAWYVLMDIDGVHVTALSSLMLPLSALVETEKPRIIEDRDVILKVTGTTIC